jgi:hypothetical protein
MLVRLDDLDLTDPAVQENWYLAYDTLRDQAPVWSRLADLRLTPGANDFSHQPGFVLRALRSLHISFRSA